jgi:hypothetical protein
MLTAAELVTESLKQALPIPEDHQDESDRLIASLEDVILSDQEFLAKEFPQRPTIMHPWLPEQSTGMIYGARGIGKTQFAMGLVDAITRGASFGPWTAGDPVSCMYLDAEMVAVDVQRRLADLGTADRKARLLVYSDAYANALGFRKASVLNEKWRNALGDFLVKHEIKLWILDNLSSCTPGIDENSKEYWDPINQWLLGLRFKGVSTLLLHHEGKSGSQRGTSSREDNLDYCISLKRPPDYVIEDGAHFIAKFTKCRIPTEHLSLIADTVFKLIQTTGDCAEWTWRDARAENTLKILRLSDEGLGVTDIASIIGVDKAHVSRTRKKAIDDCLLTKTGKLTQLGHQKCFGNWN